MANAKAEDTTPDIAGMISDLRNLGVLKYKGDEYEDYIDQARSLGVYIPNYM